LADSIFKKTAYIIIVAYLLLSAYQGTLNFTQWNFTHPRSGNVSLDAQGRTGVYVSSSSGDGGSSSGGNSDIEMLKIYDSTTADTELNRIDWGLCYVAQAKSKMLYLKNIYTTNISLGLSAKDWVPENASDYISIDWDYRNQTIMPNEVLLAKLTLWVAANITGITNFSCNVTISTYET
jgi:hypothetical protein